MNPTMILFGTPCMIEDDSDDDDGDDDDKENDYIPMMPDCNHNTVKPKTIGEIVNQTYGNPVGLQNSHDASYGDDMQAVAIHIDKVCYV